MKRTIAALACATLAFLACQPPEEVSAGEAYFILQPLDPLPSGYDFFVCNPGLDETVQGYAYYKALRPDATFLAYFNAVQVDFTITTSVAYTHIQNATRPYWLLDGDDDPVPAPDYPTTYLFDIEDSYLHRHVLPKVIDTLWSEWDGVYLDQCFNTFPTNYSTVYETHKGWSAAVTQGLWTAATTNLAIGARELLGPEYLVYANTGYPTFTYSERPWFTSTCVEAAHVTTESRRVAVTNAWRSYTDSGKAEKGRKDVHGVAWDWTYNGHNLDPGIYSRPGYVR